MKRTLDIKLGMEYTITVPFLVSPYCFYAQIMDELYTDFVEFEKMLQTYYENVRIRSELVLLKRPQLGQMCVAKYAENDQWYRALIKEISDFQKTVRVFFIDYGNEEVMPVDGNLLLLSEQFRVFPAMAVRCCLDGIKPVPDIDVPIEDVSNFMFDSLMDKVMAKFMRKVNIRPPPLDPFLNHIFK